jgi:hypothetical protein
MLVDGDGEEKGGEEEEEEPDPRDEDPIRGLTAVAWHLRWVGDFRQAEPLFALVKYGINIHAFEPLDDWTDWRAFATITSTQYTCTHRPLQSRT